jgi:phage tail tape-measure protein
MAARATVVVGQASGVVINGRVYSGRNICVANDGTVTVDGEVASGTANVPVNITVTGAVSEVTGVNVSLKCASAGTVTLTTGDVHVTGAVTGNVHTTNGDVTTGSVGGDVMVVNGDVRHTATRRARPSRVGNPSSANTTVHHNVF